MPPEDVLEAVLELELVAPPALVAPPLPVAPPAAPAPPAPPALLEADVDAPVLSVVELATDDVDVSSPPHAMYSAATATPTKPQTRIPSA